MSGRPSAEGLITHLEGAQQCLIHAHHRSGVVEFTAVIWRREQCDKVSFCEEFVSILDDLEIVCQTCYMRIERQRYERAPGDDSYTVLPPGMSVCTKATLEGLDSRIHT